jgi:two-component system response regulator
MPSRSAAVSTKHLRILLVEDNSDHAEFVRRSFLERSATVDVTHARDGEEALDYLWQRGAWAEPSKSPRPHLILLDLRLPKLDGFHVLRELKQSERLRAIPVVILTTSSAEIDVLRAYGAHANSYIVKPVGFEKFQQLVRDVEAYWCDRNHGPDARDEAGGAR